MKRILKGVALGLIALALAMPAAGMAQDRSAEEILQNLKPKKTLKRSVRKTGLSDEDAQFLDSLPARGLKVQQREKLAEIIVKQELPKIDVRILFEFDSAELSPKAHDQLAELAKALSHPSLAGVRIALNGHTDAKGSDEYNLSLSEARAVSVRRELVATYGIEPERLVAVGFGEEHLKDIQDPEGPVNRRVEVVRITK